MAIWLRNFKPMSSIRNPALKKKASLSRDHRVYAQEGDKSFRGVWKQKKRRKAKQARAQSETALRDALQGDEDAPVTAKQPKALRKTGVVTLERDLEIHREEPSLRFSLMKYSSAAFTK